MMEIKPVVRYAKPHYPNGEYVMRHPELLRRLPARFRAKPAICAALGILLSLGLTGCGTPEQDDAKGAVPTLSPTQNPTLRARSIPVFEHGNGLGSYGCVSVAPPVFLSEEEAAVVIREEALKYGLDVSQPKTLSGVSVPLHNDSPMSEDHMEVQKTVTADLELDGYDERSGIGFEFVSVDDLRVWQDPDQSVSATVSSYYLKDTAQTLAQNLTDTAVFYDPASAEYREFQWDWEGKTDAEFQKYMEDYQAAQREKSLEDLRAQVRDFLEWLQGQGVI